MQVVQNIRIDYPWRLTRRRNKTVYVDMEVGWFWSETGEKPAAISQQTADFCLEGPEQGEKVFKMTLEIIGIQVRQFWISQAKCNNVNGYTSTFSFGIQFSQHGIVLFANVPFYPEKVVGINIIIQRIKGLIRHGWRIICCIK